MYFIILIRFVIAFIQYEQGFMNKLDYRLDPTFSCSSGKIYSETITFSDQFQNVPKVILIPIKIDSFSATSGYDLEITNVNILNFIIQIICSNSPVYGIRFQWYAIDNTAISVINSFKITNFQNYSVFHFNKLASDGFISINSFRYSGALNFSITISSITSDSASIEISNPKNLNGNLLSISYQVILGPQSLIQLISTQNSLTNYASLLIAKQCNSYFMIPTFSIIYDNSQYIRINTTYVSDDPLQYTHDTWDGSKILNIYKEIQLKFTANPAHFKLESLSFLQFKQTQLKQNLLLQVNIEELNLQLSTLGSKSFTINPQIYKTINFKIYGKCISTMNIVATFKKSCNEETISFNQQCGADKQQFIFQSKHQIQNTQIENITVLLSNSSLQINQILYGSTIDTVEVVKVQLS